MSHLSRRFGAMLIAACCFTISSTNAASDCRCCVSVTAVEAAESADLVFVGEVVEAEYRWSLINWAHTRMRNLFRFDGGRFIAPRTKRTATLAVTATLNGELLENQTIHTLPTSKWCGVDFQIGEKYLVYANRRGLQMWAGQCTRTRKIEAATEDLEELRLASR